MNNHNKEYPPSHECMFCGRTIEESGGRRIVAKKFLSIGLSDKHISGGHADYPDVSVKIKDNFYVHFRGSKEKWTDELKEYAINEFAAHRHPWYCQKCGSRLCRECGSPSQYLHGCDILYECGATAHSAILPVPPGCINPDCVKHRE